jgi:hypothetical protein
MANEFFDHPILNPHFSPMINKSRTGGLTLS